MTPTDNQSQIHFFLSILSNLAMAAPRLRAQLVRRQVIPAEAGY